MPRINKMQRGSRPKATNSGARAAASVGVVMVVGLLVGLAATTRRISETGRDNVALRAQLGDTRFEIDRRDQSWSAKLEELESKTAKLSALEEARRISAEREIETMTHRLSDIEIMAKKGNEIAASSIRGEISDLRSQVNDELHRRSNARRAFQSFEDEYRRGLVLIYAEFEYEKVRGGFGPRRKRVSGWGSGFFATKNGHIITNKHVVMPWKFDPDLAALASIGDIVVDEDSLRLSCWEPGMRALDDEGRPIFSTGYNNVELHNLSIVAAAKDTADADAIELGSDGYPLHALDNNDLVILKAEGKDFFPLPISKDMSKAEVRKLDNVMVLGFPRGQNGLERQEVETSPSIGTIRKIEDTIHVTSSIIPGNSGGPLIGPNGRVIGIVTRVYSETLGICIKIDHALELLKSIRPSPNAAKAASHGDDND